MFSSHTCKHTISLLLSSIVAISLYGCPKPTTTKTDEPTTEQTTAQEPPSEPYISVGDGGFATYSEIPSDAAMPKAPAISSLTPAPKSYRDFNSKHFIGSYECTPCHNGIKDNDGNDISIETDWSSTMMANAARDPFWKAKVEQETQLHPQHKDLIADKCTVCHMPLANVESHKANKSPKLRNRSSNMVTFWSIWGSILEPFWEHLGSMFQRLLVRKPQLRPQHRSEVETTS